VLNPASFTVFLHVSALYNKSSMRYWSEAECFTIFVDSMCFRGKRIVSISPWSWTEGRISSWSAASR
jgi:hypothetical protein